LLEVQGAFVNLIQLAEQMSRQRVTSLAHQTDPPRQPKHDENAPGRLVPGPLPQRREASIEHERGRCSEQGILPQRVVAVVMVCHESSPGSGPQWPVPLHLIVYCSMRQPTMRSAPYPFYPADAVLAPAS